MQNGSPEVDVSILIKALNEETKIARAIESSLLALEGVKGEVILADSMSIDRTVDIASGYNITIVQLEDARDRSCGVGPQLGYQYCFGKYVYILDGDMQLDSEFIRLAIDYLGDKPALAGVGGQVHEENIDNYVFRSRAEKQDQIRPGITSHLAMGGLYRRSALDETGYMSNRNLHSFEEFDLGLRLMSKGWQFERLPLPAISHYGHDESTFSLLKKRWKSRYLYGPGELIRAAFGKPHFVRAVQSQKHLIVTLLIWLIVAIGVVMFPVTGYVLAFGVFLLFIIFGLLVFRKHDMRAAATSLLWWHAGAIGLVRGLFVQQKNVREWINSRIIKQSVKL